MHETAGYGVLIGKILGYLLSYAIFTTILFFILTFTGKLPATWTPLHVIAITLGVAIIGRTLTWLLR